LPHSAQVTTARDQAILGRAIQERFPRYYRYFSTRSFTYRGQRIANHNRLLGSVEGVDGIKTGYIRASGFNLVTSLRRSNRHVVAVVLGGTSAGARDARMRQLLAQYVNKASTRRTAPMVAEAPSREVPVPRAAPASRPPAEAPDQFEMASSTSTPVETAPSAGSAEPMRPIAVRTVTIRPAPKSAKAPPEAKVTASARTESSPPPAARDGVLGTLTLHTSSTGTQTVEATPAIARPANAAPRAAEAPAPPPPARPQTRSGWIIQVGAYPAESEAQQRLQTVKSKAARLLASASPFTEPVQRGETTLYRARFAGLDREQAEAACRFLKRNDVDCLTIKN
jgi:D-alanyl-D-alanine carboxypeptidase